MGENGPRESGHWGCSPCLAAEQLKVFHPFWNLRCDLSQSLSATFFGGIKCETSHVCTPKEDLEMPQWAESWLPQEAPPVVPEAPPMLLASARPFVLPLANTGGASFLGERMRKVRCGSPCELRAIPSMDSLRAEPCSHQCYCSHCSGASGKNKAFNLVMCCPSKCEIFNLASPKGCFMTYAKLHYINIIKGLALFEWLSFQAIKMSDNLLHSDTHPIKLISVFVCVCMYVYASSVHGVSSNCFEGGRVWRRCWWDLCVKGGIWVLQTKIVQLWWEKV